jgi:hypothetical protein
MKQLILTAFAVLSLTAGTDSVARAYTTGFVNLGISASATDLAGESRRKGKLIPARTANWSFHPA